MAYFSFNMSTGTQGPAQPKKQQSSGSSDSVVPQLDHDSSTLPTNSPSTTICDLALGGQTTLNPEAPWFGFDGDALADRAFQGGALQSYDQSALQVSLTTNDDLRW